VTGAPPFHRRQPRSGAWPARRTPRVPTVPKRALLYKTVALSTRPWSGDRDRRRRVTVIFCRSDGVGAHCRRLWADRLRVHMPGSGDRSPGRRPQRAQQISFDNHACDQSHRACFLHEATKSRKCWGKGGGRAPSSNTAAIPGLIGLRHIRHSWSRSTAGGC